MKCASFDRIVTVFEKNALAVQEAKNEGKKVVGQYCLYSPSEIAVAVGRYWRWPDNPMPLSMLNAVSPCNDWVKTDSKPGRSAALPLADCLRLINTANAKWALLSASL